MPVPLSLAAATGARPGGPRHARPRRVALLLVRQAIERYSTASGDWGVPIKLTQKLPKGDVYLETECPRGQMGFYLVSEGSSIPWRLRARSSCFCNLSVTADLCRGCLIADVPAIVGSLDVVMGEIDR